MSAVRVLLVDDHAVVRAGLRMLLGADPELEIVGEGRPAPRGCISHWSCCLMWFSWTFPCRI